MRYVEATELEQQTLLEGYKNHPSHTVRRRFQAILLSSQRKPVKEIASIFQIRTRTIYTWIDKWELGGVAGLFTKPGQGRPPLLDITNQEVVELVKKNSITR